MVNMEFMYDKKMTTTLEETLIDELSIIALEIGKKEIQVTRESLQNYFDTNIKNCI